MCGIRLNVERLSVALDRNDAALRAGRHAELLGELTVAVQSHPLDERLAGQLMLAQYRSGRQADALDTYRQMRERLVDELGVDPSPPLQAVHQQILDGDASHPVARPVRRGVRGHPAPGWSATADHQLRGPRTGVCEVTAALRDGPLVTLDRGRRCR